MILGNDLAGSAVWLDGPPSPVVVTKPLIAEKSQSSLGSSVFPACTVTRVPNRATVLKPPVLQDGGVVVHMHVSLPSLPQSVSCEEWGRAKGQIHPCLLCRLRLLRVFLCRNTC